MCPGKLRAYRAFQSWRTSSLGKHWKGRIGVNVHTINETIQHKQYCFLGQKVIRGRKSAACSLDILG